MNKFIGLLFILALGYGSVLFLDEIFKERPQEQSFPAIVILQNTGENGYSQVTADNTLAQILKDFR